MAGKLYRKNSDRLWLGYRTANIPDDGAGYNERQPENFRLGCGRYNGRLCNQTGVYFGRNVRGLQVLDAAHGNYKLECCRRGEYEQRPTRWNGRGRYDEGRESSRGRGSERVQQARLKVKGLCKREQGEIFKVYGRNSRHRKGQIPAK